MVRIGIWNGNPWGCEDYFQPVVGGASGEFIIFAGYTTDPGAACNALPLFVYDVVNDKVSFVDYLDPDQSGLADTWNASHDRRPQYDMYGNDIVYAPYQAKLGTYFVQTTRL